jgi:hypothetical protein
MLVALQSACNGLKRLSRLNAIDRNTAAALSLETTLVFLKGYLEEKGSLYTKHIDQTDAVGVATNGHTTEKSLDLLETWLK